MIRVFWAILTNMTPIQALIMARIDAEFQELHSSIYGVAFMGTPHRGSNSADLVSATSNIARIALLGRKTHPQLVKTLKTHSQFLLDVSRDFRHQELKKIISFYEMEITQLTNGLVSLPSLVILFLWANMRIEHRLLKGIRQYWMSTESHRLAAMRIIATCVNFLMEVMRGSELSVDNFELWQKQP